MKVTSEKIEGSRVVLTIEAPASVVDEALDKAYKSVVKRVNVPGFRRGKAPRFILERHVGKDVLYEEAMKEVLPEQYEKAVEETKIEPVSEPEFDEVNFKQGEPLKLKATVYVRPEVKLDDYDELSVPYEVQEVTGEDVDQQISFLRERMARLDPLAEDEALDKGDYAT
ncbi:MAG: trigger factor family protein [Firmicutes bacterium]|nr:trigger factor family protein [Candidatus Fermentithermobacillaceae bacterium]